MNQRTRKNVSLSKKPQDVRPPIFFLQFQSIICKDYLLIIKERIEYNH